MVSAGNPAQVREIEQLAARKVSFDLTDPDANYRAAM